MIHAGTIIAVPAIPAVSHSFALQFDFMNMDPVELGKKIAEDPAKAWAVAKTAADLATRLFAFRKNLKSSAEKHEVDEILDALSDLKQSASRLEDENRELKEKLRFKSDDYVFRTPFRYHKDRPDVALCVKCFANNVEGPMGELGVGVTRDIVSVLFVETLSRV
jgi:hypothetical protein